STSADTGDQHDGDSGANKNMETMHGTLHRSGKIPRYTINGMQKVMEPSSFRFRANPSGVPGQGLKASRFRVGLPRTSCGDSRVARTPAPRRSRSRWESA